MPKTAYGQWSATAASNTDINGIDIDEGCAMAGLNNAIREMMAQLKTEGFISGVSSVLTTPQINDTSADHQYIFAVSELAADRTVTLPLLTGNDTLVFQAHTQTLTNKTLTSPTITTPTLTLKQSATPTPTAEGDIQWDTDDNVIVVGDGAAQKIFAALPASAAAGDMLYLSAAKVLTRVAIGTAGQLWTVNAGATAPGWAAAPASGWDMTGQTWQTVARTTGTQYQNTTGEPLAVAVRGGSTSLAVTFNFKVNAISGTTGELMLAEVSNVFVGSGAYEGKLSISHVVPPGHYYRITGNFSAVFEVA